MVDVKEIVLNDELLLAKGGQRFCYLHPDDRTKVIKILPEMEKSNQQNELEHVYLGYLRKRKVSFKHIAKCYGYVATNLGKGLVFERVLNEDGTPASSMQYMIINKEINETVQRELLVELLAYLRDNQILFVDVCLSNVFCYKDLDHVYSLKIVDGLGARRLNYKFWLYLYIGLYRRYKIYKQGKKVLRFHSEDLLKMKNDKTKFRRM